MYYTPLSILVVNLMVTTSDEVALWRAMDVDEKDHTCLCAIADLMLQAGRQRESEAVRMIVEQLATPRYSGGGWTWYVLFGHRNHPGPHVPWSWICDGAHSNRPVSIQTLPSSAELDNTVYGYFASPSDAYRALIESLVVLLTRQPAI